MPCSIQGIGATKLKNKKIMEKNKIKLTTFWVSDCYNSKKSKVYKTLGFESKYKKDKYYTSENVIMYYDEDNNLLASNPYSQDVKLFKTKQEALCHQKKRKQHWIDWYKEQIEDYTQRLNEAIK